jgi:hypothetical protein
MFKPAPIFVVSFEMDGAKKSFAHFYSWYEANASCQELHLANKVHPIAKGKITNISIHIDESLIVDPDIES